MPRSLRKMSDYAQIQVCLACWSLKTIRLKTNHLICSCRSNKGPITSHSRNDRKCCSPQSLSLPCSKCAAQKPYSECNPVFPTVRNSLSFFCLVHIIPEGLVYMGPVYHCLCAKSRRTACLTTVRSQSGKGTAPDFLILCCSHGKGLATPRTLFPLEEPKRGKS